MKITEVRIKLMDDPSERLQAFCSITFDDCFVVRDLKIIEGTNGPFVAMPSRKLTSHCPQCGSKNHLRAAHCNQCGSRLPEGRAVRDSEGRAKLYADIAHPINSGCREMIQQRVIEDFRTEQSKSGQPGYVSHYEDYDEDFDVFEDDRPAADPPQVQPAAQEPRPPHQKPIHPTSHPSTGPNIASRDSEQSSGGPKSSGFGAGIF